MGSTVASTWPDLHYRLTALLCKRRHSQADTQRAELLQENGPGRSKRCARAREFHDHRPIFNVQDERPDCVMFNRSGPKRMIFRYTRPIAITFRV
jgi:hypothetical protein